jgi:hypothetical protein
MTEAPNRAARRMSEPAKPSPVAAWRKGLGSAKRRERRAMRALRGSRTLDAGLTPLDEPFGIHSPIVLLVFGTSRELFHPDERARRRAVGKRARAARKANRR